MASVSLLESVAQHEKALMAELELARNEARQIIEAAHIESAATLQETNTKLEADIATLRRDAAVAREEVRQAIQKATAEKIQSIRNESAGRTAQVRAELLARILPNVDQ
jgi:vacuolar-type H+-ATPase subunit H